MIVKYALILILGLFLTACEGAAITGNSDNTPDPHGTRTPRPDGTRTPDPYGTRTPTPTATPTPCEVRPC